MPTSMPRKSNFRRCGRIALVTALAFTPMLSVVGVRRHVAAMAKPQVQSTPPKTMPDTPMDSMPGVTDNSKDRMESQRARMWSDERHKKLVLDTDKLLQLATELKTEVDKSTRNELSVTVIQKAGEIEKLSHDVKERMKN
jgi:hypothetical protein